MGRGTGSKLEIPPEDEEGFRDGRGGECLKLGADLTWLGPKLKPKQEVGILALSVAALLFPLLTKICLMILV